MSAPRSGIAMAAIGIAFMCGMDAVAKALGAELSTFQIVFARYLGAALWLALWIVLSRGTWPGRADIPRQAMRAVLLFLTATMFFYAVGQLPIAMVAALGMTAPLYVTLLGALIFGEPVTARGWTALALGGMGAAIIVLTGASFSAAGGLGHPLAWAAALLAPLSYAVLLVVLKHHSGHEAPETMTVGQSLIAALIALPFAFGEVPQLTGQAIGLVTLIGLLGAVGFLLLINGLKKIPVTVFAVIDYTGLLWAATFGLVFFHEVPGMQVWIGGALIVAACAITTAPAKQVATS